MYVRPLLEENTNLSFIDWIAAMYSSRYLKISEQFRKQIVGKLAGEHRKTFYSTYLELSFKSSTPKSFRLGLNFHEVFDF